MPHYASNIAASLYASSGEEIGAALVADWHTHYAHFYLDAESYLGAKREDGPTFENGLR